MHIIPDGEMPFVKMLQFLFFYFRLKFKSTMANKAFFINTDISGYTEYLTASELEHAHQILQSLFDAQLANIKFPLKVSGFRGDAIFMYTPDTNFLNPQSFVETLENLYIVFSDTLQQMKANTTCTCNACKNMLKLDLKICTHYGEYMLQRLGDHEELLGADVIIPHRMLKNQVIEKTGIKAYSLFSEAAAKQLNLDVLCTPLIDHVESYEHLGEINMKVFDLKLAWQNYLDEQRFVVNPETAWIKIEVDVPYPPSLIWDYITTPAIEGPILGLESVIRVDDKGGRTKPGANFHCAHKMGDFFNKIIDWKPFSYYTTQQDAGGLQYYRTIRFDYDGQVTKLGVYISEPNQEPPQGFREFLESTARPGYERLPAAIKADVESGKVSTSAS